jgi:ABC-type uncharacterized transport system ATPase subunit
MINPPKLSGGNQQRYLVGKQEKLKETAVSFAYEVSVRTCRVL